VKMTRQGVRDLGRSSPARTDAVRERSPIAVLDDGRPRVAVDVCVSSSDIDALEGAGFYVAVVAEHGEPDHQWLLRATVAGVSVVVSPDKEVWAFAYEQRWAVVRVRNSKTGDVVSRVRAALERSSRYVTRPFLC